MNENSLKFKFLSFLFMFIFIPIGYAIFIIQNFIEFLKGLFDMYEFKESLRNIGDSLLKIRLKVYKFTHNYKS